jgi:hypothetical protein
MIKAAGASFKLRHPSTGVMTEVASWFTDINPDNDQDTDEANFFNPNGALPTKVRLYGAISRGYTLVGKWKPAADAFFSSLQGETNVPFEFCPEGTAVGKLKRSGSVNVGGWADPGGNANGSWDSSISMAVNEQLIETIAAAPSAKTITSSSVADPSVITTSAAHLLSVGSVVVIAGHTGSTPDLNKAHVVTSIPTSTTFTIPVSVTVGGTGGTVQD